MERVAEESENRLVKYIEGKRFFKEKKYLKIGGRLAHQKSIGSKEKRCIMLLKPLEHRIAAFRKVEAPEGILAESISGKVALSSITATL